jgi:NAD(P)-dependent dehydrogenase (short-subunit alcohol dehydrogenase family)
VSTLEGSVAVVTGAAGGLGGAIVAALRDAGATPVPLDRAGGGPDAITCDVTDRAAVAEAAAWVERRHGRCDVLVNNAAILERAPLEEHPVDLWDRVIAVNVTGYFLCTQAFGALMLAGGGGSIVNVSSLAGESPSFGNGAYCASKAGVLALTRQTAVEWGPRGIRTNAVSPSFMRTPMMAEASPEFELQRTHNVPLGRIADTAEVAAAVAFLASPRASYLNGINMQIDGGLAQARAAGWDGPGR